MSTRGSCHKWMGTALSVSARCAKRRRLGLQETLQAVHPGSSRLSGGLLLESWPAGSPDYANGSNLELGQFAMRARGHHRHRARRLRVGLRVGLRHLALPRARSVQPQAAALASRSSPDVAIRCCSGPPAIYYKTLRCRAQRPRGGRLHSAARWARKDPGLSAVQKNPHPWVCRGFPKELHPAFGATCRMCHRASSPPITNSS